MAIGEVLDYLYGYELRQSKANHRARRIMSAFVGEDPYEIWPLFTDDLLDHPKAKQAKVMDENELKSFIDSLPWT